MGTVYAVGVGPGSQDYVTDIVRKIIQNSDVIAGYKYTLKTIGEFISDKEVYEITMHSQEEVYQKIKTKLGNKTLMVPFTGDVNFSESEVYRVLKSPGKFFFREYGSGKGLKEIADIFRGRLVRARDPSFYTQRLQFAGFRNISLREFDVKREYSFNELFQVMQMFPFLDHVTEEDKTKIKDYFGSRDKTQITSDQIIIIGEK